MTSAEKKIIDQYRRQGMGSTEIAEKLGLSVNTVKSYCRRNAMETPRASVDAAPSGLCKQCGALISGKQDKRGKQFCSDRCRRKYWNEHQETPASGMAERLQKDAGLPAPSEVSLDGRR